MPTLEDAYKFTQAEFEEQVVDDFAKEMKQKLDKYRTINPHSFVHPVLKDLQGWLELAVADGDMISVANYAMMIHWANTNTKG